MFKKAKYHFFKENFQIIYFVYRLGNLFSLGYSVILKKKEKILNVSWFLCIFDFGFMGEALTVFEGGAYLTEGPYSRE